MNEYICMKIIVLYKYVKPGELENPPGLFQSTAYVICMYEQVAVVIEAYGG